MDHHSISSKRRQNPSFGLNVQTGAFKDHGTDETGDIVTLVEQIMDLGNKEAITWINKELDPLFDTTGLSSSYPINEKIDEPFWTSDNILLLSESQERLKKESAHPLIGQVLSYDQITIGFAPSLRLWDPEQVRRRLAGFFLRFRLSAVSQS